MSFVSTGTWRDLTNGHLYHEGDQFPFDGGDVPAERLEALENGRNQAGLRLIKPVEVKVERTEVRKEEAPKQAVKVRETAMPKTRRKAR